MATDAEFRAATDDMGEEERASTDSISRLTPSSCVVASSWTFLMRTCTMIRLLSPFQNLNSSPRSSLA